MMAIPVAAQQKPAPAAKPAARAKAYTAPKTPWGDPNIAGVFTNNDESGIPIERPNQFEGKQLEDVSEGELQQLRDQRETQRVAAAPNLGGIPGTNPVHWFENFGAKNSRAWSLIDPADGRIPPTTEEARTGPRAAAGAASAAARSTATRTSASTTAASPAAFPAR